MSDGWAPGSIAKLADRVGPEASAHAGGASCCCRAAERAEDRNSGAEATAQARIAVVTRTATTAAGDISPSSGARVHGGSRHSDVLVRRPEGAPAGTPEPGRVS